MRSRSVIMAAVLTTLTAAPMAPAYASEIIVNTGLGYDLLSQQYFDDSLIQDSPDSLLQRWSLTTDYLNDLKAFFELTYLPLSSSHLETRARYELSADFVRARLSSSFKTTAGQILLNADGELEGKAHLEDSSEFGDDYWRAYGRMRASTSLANDLSGKLQLSAEQVDFAGPADYSYDFFRLAFKAGLERSLGGFSFAEVNLFQAIRNVPDTRGLSYLSYGFEGSVLGFYPGAEIDLLGRIERKDYNNVSGGDYTLVELNGRGKLQLGHGLISRQALDGEISFYPPEDSVYVTWGRLRLAGLFGWESATFGIIAGPHMEWLDESQELISEAYFEYGARVDVDYMNLGGLLVSAESVVGHRKHSSADPLGSDFNFERLSMIGDLQFAETISMTVLFSAEWEWHDLARDDSRLYLLTTSLSYCFP